MLCLRVRGLHGSWYFNEWQERGVGQGGAKEWRNQELKVAKEKKKGAKAKEMSELDM